jgi:hypothetical protein
VRRVKRHASRVLFRYEKLDGYYKFDAADNPNIELPGSQSFAGSLPFK